MEAADGQLSSRPDADEECEFCYQPEGRGRAYRLLALGYRKAKKPQPGEAEEYQRFETPDSAYRVLVTNLSHTVELLVWAYKPRGEPRT